MSEWIPDANLHLALLDELQDAPEWAEDLEEDYENARGAHPDWRPWDELFEDPYEPNPDLETFVRGLPFPHDGLDTLKRLTLDGDRDVYALLGGETWYEDPDLFVIRDLTGLERCGQLQYLHLGQGLHRGCSLQPLAAMGQLEELWLCALDGYRDIETLLQLPALRRLEVANVETSPERATWELMRRAWRASRES